MQHFFQERPRRTPVSQSKRDRHRRASCSAKRPCTLEEATQRAQRLNALENRPYGVHVYRCLYCPAFHVGRMRPYLRAENVRVFLEMEAELGERAWGCTMGENWGTRRARRTKIAERYNSRFRKLWRT